MLSSLDAVQVLTEHTAAVPALLQVLDGHLRITADERAVELRPGGLRPGGLRPGGLRPGGLRPGGLVHLAAGLLHAVEAVEASRLQLTMFDPPVST